MKDFLSYAENNDLNIFKLYNSEEDCLKNLKYAIELKSEDFKNVNSLELNDDILNIHENDKNSLLYNLHTNIINLKSSEFNINDLYKDVYTENEFENIKNLKINPHILKVVKNTEFYKNFIKDIKNLKNENHYTQYFNDDRKKLFFYNFVKNNLVETKYSCGLLSVENVNYYKKQKNVKFSYLFGLSPQSEGFKGKGLYKNAPLYNKYENKQYGNPFHLYYPYVFFL